MSLDHDERYSRQILFRGVGAEGQKRLAAARVAVVGCGATGSVVSSLLARAGVGTIRIIDRDYVEPSNLQRQTLFDEADARESLPKAIAAARQIAAFNSQIVVEAKVADLTPENIEPLLEGVQLILDGTDNFETRYLVADACYFARKPLVTAAVGVFDGTLTTIRAHERDAQGRPNPSYRCLFPEPPPPGAVPACAEAGVLGALTGVLGSLMALEVIREIVGFGEGLVGRLLMVDARSMRFETLTYAWDPTNPLTGDKPTITMPGIGRMG